MNKSIQPCTNAPTILKFKLNAGNYNFSKFVLSHDFCDCLLINNISLYNKNNCLVSVPVYNFGKKDGNTCSIFFSDLFYSMLSLDKKIEIYCELDLKITVVRINNGRDKFNKEKCLDNVILKTA